MLKLANEGASPGMCGHSDGADLGRFEAERHGFDECFLDVFFKYFYRVLGDF